MLIRLKFLVGVIIVVEQLEEIKRKDADMLFMMIASVVVMKVAPR